jgi:hypothetical protein
MFGERIRGFILRHVSTEVPDEMAACLDCRAAQCSYTRYRDCPNRLAQAAALRALREQAAECPGDVGRRSG